CAARIRRPALGERRAGTRADLGLRLVLDFSRRRRARLRRALVADHARQVRRREVSGTGGESGIRTHGTLLTYTRFPSVRLKPLGHLSGRSGFNASAAQRATLLGRLLQLLEYPWVFQCRDVLLDLLAFGARAQQPPHDLPRAWR